MSRSTSASAFATIQENGLLSEKRQQTYEGLYRYGPCTASELVQRIGGSGIAPNQIRARLNELRDRGVVQEVGTKVCKVTNMRVINWDVTANLPADPIVTAKKCLTCGHVKRGK